MTFTDVHTGHQKVPKSDFQSDFSMSKNVQIFLKKISLKNINLGLYFLFDNFKIERLLFLNWLLIFDGPCEHLWMSNQKIILILLTFLLKSTPCWLTSAKLYHWGHSNITWLACCFHLHSFSLRKVKMNRMLSKSLMQNCCLWLRKVRWEVGRS